MAGLEKEVKKSVKKATRGSSATKSKRSCGTKKSGSGVEKAPKKLLK